VRRSILLLLLAWPAAAGSPTDAIRRGLGAEARGARFRAEAAARELARTDPGALEALWGGLDLRGRCGLVRALAASGTRHAALVALQHAGDPSPEVFRALLDGLAAGGEKALFAPVPEGLSQKRRRAVEWLRLRWRVEAELVRLKSPAGSTGHYTGQFSGFAKFGPGVIDIFFDILQDRAVPLPGEAGSGPFESIHPEMVRYDKMELRDLVACGFGEMTTRRDLATVRRILKLFKRYWSLDEEGGFDFEHNSLAPNLAYSLFDLGVRSETRTDKRWASILRAHGLARAPHDIYISKLVHDSKGYSYTALRALWQLGYAYIRVGQHALGESYYKRILAMPAESGVSRHLAAYNLACNFSMRARQDPRRRQYYKRLAIYYLQEAVRLELWDWGWMEADGDLDFIRATPEYKAILAALKAKYPERRKGSSSVSKKVKDFLGGRKKK